MKTLTAMALELNFPLCSVLLPPFLIGARPNQLVAHKSLSYPVCFLMISSVTRVFLFFAFNKFSF